MTLRITLSLSLWAALGGGQVFAEGAPGAKDEVFERALGELFAAGGLTADQAASRAGKASPTVRRAIAEIDAAIAQTETAGLTRVPQIGARLSYARLSPLVAVNLGAFTIPVFLNSYVAEASIAVPLSDYVLRFPRILDVAKLGEQAARLGKRSSEVGAGQDARVAYYEWVRARLGVLVARRQLEQVRSVLGQFRALAEAQRVSRADLLRVESQEAVAEQALDQLQNLSSLREEQLRLLIGADPQEQLAIGEDIRGDVPAGAVVTEKLDALVGTAKAQRLEFRAIDLGIAAKDKARLVDRASQYPRLSAFAAASYLNPNQRAFPPEDKFDLTWSLGAQLTWTLNDLLGSRATDRRLAAETASLRAEREHLERGTRIQLLAAQQAVALANHALATSQKGLLAAAEGYRVRRELLAAARATSVELIDAETDLTRARIAALNARVDLRVALAQLDHALGNDAK